MEVHWRGLLIEGEVSEFIPGRTYGPPEDCYPAEGGVCEDGATLTGVDATAGELLDEWEEDLRQAFEDADERHERVMWSDALAELSALPEDHHPTLEELPRFGAAIDSTYDVEKAEAIEDYARENKC